MRQYLALVLISTLLAAVPITQAAQSSSSSGSLDQVFAKMDQASKVFRSIEANIERTQVTVLVNDRDTTSGKFYYMRSGKDPRLKLELTKPMPDYVLIDKGKLQHYRPNLKQVQEYTFGKGQSNQVEMFMALGFGQSSQELKSNWDVSLAGDEVVNGQKTTILDLKPKTPGMFKSVRIWLDQQKWIAVQMRINQSSGDYMDIKYTSPKLNSGVSDSKFKLNMPKDVKVIKL